MIDLCKRPRLDPCDLPNPFPERGGRYITMSPGQWDAILDAMYNEGWTLLDIEEINGRETCVRAFRRKQ